MPTSPPRLVHPPVDRPDAPPAPATGEGLREVMRGVPTPVTVVTVSAGGERRGATIGSFASLSLDPPLVSFNVIRDTAFHAVLLRAETLAIHLLSGDQAELADHFAQPGLDEESLFGSRMPGYDGPPILRDARTVLHCRPWAVHEAGDHHLVIAEVETIFQAGGAAEPLLYLDRRYRRVGEVL